MPDIYDKHGTLLLTTAEACGRLNIKPSTLDTQRRLGKIEGVRVGRDWRYKITEVERYRREVQRG